MVFLLLKNILKQYELYEDTDFFYIVMDAARGGDLCLELDEFGAFIEEAAAALMQQLLSCINYLHSSDIVHCDLKESIHFLRRRSLFSGCVNCLILMFLLASVVHFHSRKI